MPQVIQNPVVGQLLQRAFNLQGRVRPALDEIIVPTVSLGELAPGSAPPITRAATARFSQAAVVGERFVARFEVPGNVIAVINALSIQASTAGPVFVHFGSSIAAGATTAQKSYADGRLIDQGETPAAVLTYDTQVGNLATIDWGVSGNPTTGQRFEPRGWVVGTGRRDQFGFLEFNYGTDNLTVGGALEWTEYAIV